MLFDALALPRNVVIGIFKFVDDRSLIRAREACKPARETVDEIILETRKTELCCVMFHRQNSNNGIRISISFEGDNKMRNAAMLMLSFNHVIKHRDDMEIILKPFRQFDHFRTISLKLKGKEEAYFKLFEQLHSKLKNTKIGCVEISFIRPESVRMCTILLEGKCVHWVNIGNYKGLSKNALKDFKMLNYFPYLDLVQKLRIDIVMCDSYDLNQDFRIFLVKLSFLTTNIMVLARGKNNVIDYFSLAKEMLSHKCEQLYFSIAGREMPLIDAEKIVQYALHIDKKIHFSAWNKEEPFDNQVGPYKAIAETNPFGVRITIHPIGKPYRL